MLALASVIVADGDAALACAACAALAVIALPVATTAPPHFEQSEIV